MGANPQIETATESREVIAPGSGHARVQSLLVRILRFRLELILIVVLGGFALGSRMSAAPLVDWDEATYAEVAHEAVANHSYLDFTWNGRSYAKKPPLLFWAIAGSFKVLGESEFAARLPSVVAGLATLLLIYLTAAGVAGRLAGTLAALAPLQFYFFIARGGRDCATDAPLLFFLTLALYAILRAREDRRFCALAGVASGLAILSKGLAGTIPLIIAPLAMFVLPGFEAIGLAGLAIVFGCAVAVAAPWYLYEALYNPGFWTSFVHHETLARVAQHLEDQTQPGWYTLYGFWKEVRFLWPLILPGVALAIAAVGSRTVRGAFASAASRWRVDQPCDESLDRMAGRCAGRGLRSADQAALVRATGVSADGVAGGNAGRARVGVPWSDENRGGGTGRAGAGTDTRACAGTMAHDRPRAQS